MLWSQHYMVFYEKKFSGTPQGHAVLFSCDNWSSRSLLYVSSLSLKVDPIIFQIVESDLQSLHILIVATST